MELAVERWKKRQEHGPRDREGQAEHRDPDHQQELREPT
jgi:hypothetical protein